MLEPKYFYKFTKFWEILILTLWFVTLPCFLTKIAQILQKVIVFFLERGKKIEPWFWHIWIAQWWKIFPTAPHLFQFRSYSGGNGGLKLDQKWKLWVCLFFMKTRVLQIFFKQCFCWLEYYLWWEFWQCDVIFGGVRAQKPPKKDRGMQNFENF